SLYVDRTLPIFLVTETSPSAIYTLSLHDALPISVKWQWRGRALPSAPQPERGSRSERHPLPRLSQSAARRSPAPTEPELPIERRSEEHTSELQSPYDLVCRLLLEKKKPRTNEQAP